MPRLRTFVPTGTQAVFAVVWLVTAVAFAALSVDSWNQKHITLTRYKTDLPEGNGSVFIGGRNLGGEINTAASTTNENIGKLEESIRATGRLTLALNLVSCLGAVAGFVAQIFDARKPEALRTE